MNKYSRYRDGIDGGIFDDGRSRIFLLGMLFFTAFTVLALRLYYLQLHKGEEHRRLIAGQSIRDIRNPGRRGGIYTADGEELDMREGRDECLEICRLDLAVRKELDEIRARAVGKCSLGGSERAGDRNESELDGLPDNVGVGVG